MENSHLEGEAHSFDAAASQELRSLIAAAVETHGPLPLPQSTGVTDAAAPMTSAHGTLTFAEFAEIVDAINDITATATDARIIRAWNATLTKLLATALTQVSQQSGYRRALSDTLQARSGRTIPWKDAMPAATGVAFLYNFSPFQDTGATVASKRIRNFERSFDVISCSFLHRKKQDYTVESIAEPYITSKYFLPLAPSWASWEPFKAFAVRASAFAEKKLRNGAQYDMMYSRAMWAPSMFAAKLFKSRHPEIRWVAEFSDPMSLDVEGLPRGGEVPDDALSRAFIEDIVAEYPELRDQDFSIFSLAETLVYAFADDIMFTNSNQMKEMLDHISSDRLRDRVKSKAIVSNHPTLPRQYYLREDSGYVVDDAKLNLGYFGEFYSSRSITEVTSAMRTLPEELRKRVHLHVFTNFIPSGPGNQRPRNMSKRQYDDYVRRAYDGVGAEGIEDQVTFNASLPFLKFLATTEKLDYLIVNDAKTGSHHSVNPFLPSKWSDYAGSSAKSWGFVEPSSILSSKPVTVKTPVGDALAARTALWKMVEEKFGPYQEGVNHADPA